MSRQPPTQSAPPVQRLRLRYAKRGRLRFASHRDFARAFERALRRAQIPMAYSSGFSPHPRISYANAAPTGAASEAEYVEIALVQEADPQAVRAALDESLPEGLDVLEVVVSPGGGLADRLEGSRWQVEVPGVPEDVSARAIEEFLASGEVLVERLMKNGVRSFDAREPVLALRQCGPATLDLVVRHGTPLVRPDDVLRALGAVVPVFAPTAPARITRLAQGPLTGSPEPAEIIGDPFA